MIKCGWCQGTKYHQVGVEWSGHAIYACKEPGCGHEWVETSILAGKSSFFDNLDQMVAEVIAEQKKKP